MEIDLSTGTPPSPGHTLQLAEAFAEIARVLNHQTADHGALQYPAEADRFLREITMAVFRLDQLLAQQGAWLEREREAGRISVPDGPHAGNPGSAVVTARLGLDWARTHLAEAVTALKAATSVTSTLAAREGGDDDGR